MGCEDLFSKRTIRNWVGKFLLFLSTFLAVISLSWAGSNTGADFLKIPSSARSVSLGNADTALASGVDSIDRNSAGLGRGPAALSFSHQQIFGENNLDNLAASWPGRGSDSYAWGLSINRLAYAVQQRRGSDRSVSGSFGASDLSVGLSVAKTISMFRVGTQIKMIRQDLAGYSASGMAMDLGLQSPTPFSRLSMGLAVRNLGPQMKFIAEEFHLPLMVSGGVAYKMIQPLTLVFDVQHSPYQKQTAAALGLEFSVIDSLTMRAGYLNKLVQAVNNNQVSETNRGNFGGIGGLSGGLGFKLGTFSMDYAIAPFGELGTNHVFTLSTSFGKPSAPVALVEEKPKEDDRGIVIFAPVEKTFGQNEPDSTLPE